jgi:hypothetical protein
MFRHYSFDDHLKGDKNGREKKIGQMPERVVFGAGCEGKRGASTSISRNSPLSLIGFFPERGDTTLA